MALTLLFISAGWLAALPCVADLVRASGLMAAITITAFVGSFLYAFAELAANERWQKFVLQHAPEFMLGLYVPVAWYEAKHAGILLLASAGIVHVAVWKASVHSRKFRWKLFNAVLKNEVPNIARIVSLLKGRGRSDLADRILLAIYNGGTLDWRPIEIEFPMGQYWLFDHVVEEMSKYCSQKPPERISQ